MCGGATGGGGGGGGDGDYGEPFAQILFIFLKYRYRFYMYLRTGLPVRRRMSFCYLPSFEIVECYLKRSSSNLRELNIH